MGIDSALHGSRHLLVCEWEIFEKHVGLPEDSEDICPFSNDQKHHILTQAHPFNWYKFHTETQPNQYKSSFDFLALQKKKKKALAYI